MQPLYARLFFIAFGIAMILYVVRALKTGRLPLRIADQVYRNERPIMFWWSVIVAMLMGPAILVLAIFGAVKISN